MYHWHLSKWEAQEEYLCLCPAGVTDDFLSFKAFKSFFLLSLFLLGGGLPSQESIHIVGRNALLEETRSTGKYPLAKTRMPSAPQPAVGQH